MMSLRESNQLTKEEIDQLFQFTERKMVRWYDLQVELVDHLACRIEEEILKDNSLSFEAALERVYSDFGIFGFSRVVQEKEKQIRKAASRMWWKEMLHLFSWPQVISTFAIGMVLYQLTQLVEVNLLMRIFVAAYSIATVRLMVLTNRSTDKSRRLLLLQSGSTSLYLAIWFYIMPMWQEVSVKGFLFLSFIGTMAIICSYQVFLKIKKKAIELYPEAFAS